MSDELEDEEDFPYVISHFSFAIEGIPRLALDFEDQ
jgi:hypothetical protein